MLASRKCVVSVKYMAFFPIRDEAKNKISLNDNNRQSQLKKTKTNIHILYTFCWEARPIDIDNSIEFNISQPNSSWPFTQTRKDVLLYFLAWKWFNFVNKLASCCLNFAIFTCATSMRGPAKTVAMHRCEWCAASYKWTKNNIVIRNARIFIINCNRLVRR